MQLNGERTFSLLRRENLIAVLVFFLTAIFFISLSVFATTVGTNIDSTGTTGAATSTPWGTLAVDAENTSGYLDPIFVVGDNATATPAMFVSQKGVVSFGSSTPSNLFLNVGDVVIGRHGATNDLFVSGGLGVGDATTTDNGFVVGANLFTVYANGNIGMFGTSSPVVIDGLSLGGAAGTHADLYVSGGLGVGDATTTDNSFVVGTNILTVYANSNIGMFGTSSPLLVDGLSLGGAAGTHADVYISGGLGIANATTSDGHFVVGGDNDFIVYSNGKVGIGGTTTIQGFSVKSADSLFSSNADSTTTVGIMSNSSTKGGCIELTDSTGALFKLFIASDTASTSLYVQAGACN